LQNERSPYTTRSYEIIRAKTLYSAEAHKMGSGIRAGHGKVEYGSHIPTLIEQAENL
jgi:transposase